MGRKRSRHSWEEARKLCRLNHNDIAMAKSLEPDNLIRSRPGPKEQWKLPVKDWIRELHRQRFGYVVGEKQQLSESKPEAIVCDEDLARLFEEELYWEDYRDRNEAQSAAEITHNAAPKRGRRL